MDTNQDSEDSNTQDILSILSATDGETLAIHLAQVISNFHWLGQQPPLLKVLQLYTLLSQLPPRYGLLSCNSYHYTGVAVFVIQYYQPDGQPEHTSGEYEGRQGTLMRVKVIDEDVLISDGMMVMGQFYGMHLRVAKVKARFKAGEAQIGRLLDEAEAWIGKLVDETEVQVRGLVGKVVEAASHSLPPS